MEELNKIGLGGGCHWCTEAVFQSLKGVHLVAQGYINSDKKNSAFSEAVLVHYHPSQIALQDLIEIHLLTHKSSSDHSFRQKYRSAIYYFSKAQKQEAEKYLALFQNMSDTPPITKILKFKSFKSSRDSLRNYYQKNPKKPFCERYITPKLDFLKSKYKEKLRADL